MTPKEWAFVTHVVEESCKWAYERGHNDGRLNKPNNTRRFKLTSGDLLKLKKELGKYVEKR